MKIINYIKPTFILILFVLFASGVDAQTKYELLPKSSEIKVEGTSTIHDWHMMAEKPISKFNAEIEDSKILVDNLNFQLKAENILSDNSIMDSKAHKSLKSEDHPIIRFMSLSDLTLLKEENIFKTSVKGKIQIAGETKEISFPVETIITEDSQLEVTGKMTLEFGDFKIKAPTALMGTVKTGEAITITFKLRYKNIEG